MFNKISFVVFFGLLYRIYAHYSIRKHTKNMSFMVSEREVQMYHEGINYGDLEQAAENGDLIQ